MVHVVSMVNVTPTLDNAKVSRASVSLTKSNDKSSTRAARSSAVSRSRPLCLKSAECASSSLLPALSSLRSAQGR